MLGLVCGKLHGRGRACPTSRPVRKERKNNQPKPVIRYCLKIFILGHSPAPGRISYRFSNCLFASLVALVPLPARINDLLDQALLPPVLSQVRVGGGAPRIINHARPPPSCRLSLWDGAQRYLLDRPFR